AARGTSGGNKQSIARQRGALAKSSTVMARCTVSQVAKHSTSANPSMARPCDAGRCSGEGFASRQRISGRRPGRRDRPRGGEGFRACGCGRTLSGCYTRRVRWTAWLMTALVGGLLASIPSGLELAQAGSATFRPDILPVDQIRPGMKGYGLTVFEGTKPERFGVEVIDVIKNFRPRQDAILIKTVHPRLDVVNVVRGMSGS